MSRITVEDAALLEDGEHVIAEDPGPEIAVVTRVVAEEVAESGLEVCALREGEPRDGVQLAHRAGSVAVEPGRVDGEVVAGEEHLAQLLDAGAHVLRAD